MIDPRSVLDVAVGGYAASLAVGVVGAIAASPPPGPVASAGAATGVFLVAFAGARSADRLHHAVDGWIALAALAVPVGWFAWFVVAAVDGGVVRYPVGVAAGGVVPAGVAVVVAHEVRFRERRAGATDLLSFEARPSPGRRKVLVGGYVVVLAALVGITGLVALSGGDVDPLTTVVPVLGGSAAVLPAIANDREVTLTDEGVVVGRVHRDWDAFDAYAVTEDAVVLSRPGWRGSHRFDRSDLEDAEAVDRLLSRHLPRRSARP